MNDLRRLKEAYLNFKRQDFAIALKIYRSLLDGGRCDSRALHFFIQQCEGKLNAPIELSKNNGLKGLTFKENLQAEEISRIEKSTVFDAKFYENIYGHCLSSGMTAAEDFCCRGWKAYRDPNPFFSIARYLQYEDSVDASGDPINPLIDYLDSDFDLVKAEHAGMFDYFKYVNHPLTSFCFAAKVACSPVVKQDLKILVVIHAYYPERLNRILASLKHIPYSFELVITVCSCEDKDVVQSYLKNVDLSVAAFEIRVVPNHGRDLLPFVRVVKDLHSQHKTYDFVLKLHSKKSETRAKNTAFGDRWLSSILSNLLGSPANVQFILLTLFQIDDCALVSSLTSVEVFRFCKWKTNLDPIAHLVDVFHIEENPDDPICFPAGSMFWVDFQSAVKIASCFEESLVPLEPLANNGTYLHSFERLIPYILRANHTSMQPHCNLDLNRVQLISFQSLISCQKFDDWMTAFIGQMVQPMINNRSLQKWHFPAYHNPTMLCVVVGDQLELIMITLISLYFSRSFIDYQIIICSSSLSSLERQKILSFFPGIAFHCIRSDLDQLKNFVSFISQIVGSRILLFSAGYILSPVKAGHALSVFSQNEALFYLLKRKDQQGLEMHDTILLAKKESLAVYLRRFCDEPLESHDLANNVYRIISESPSVAYVSCDSC